MLFLSQLESAYSQVNHMEGNDGSLDKPIECEKAWLRV
jgi:hypothetical protein